MNIKAEIPQTRPEDVKIPEGVSLADWIESNIARYESRTLDWNALKFQADYDPKYKRAQMRYIGTGAAGVTADSNVVQANNFTFSTMVLPAGCEGPLHLHTDAEEVFFWRFREPYKRLVPKRLPPSSLPSSSARSLDRASVSSSSSSMGGALRPRRRSLPHQMRRRARRRARCPRRYGGGGCSTRSANAPPPATAGASRPNAHAAQTP